MPKNCSASDLRWSGSRRAQSEANAAWSKLQKSQRKKKPSKSKRKNHRRSEPCKVNYRKYIKSKAWQRIRTRAIEHADGQCRKCGSRMNIQVHHKHYQTLGRERLSDLDVICRQCHADGHLADVLGFDNADEMWRFAGLT